MVLNSVVPKARERVLHPRRLKIHTRPTEVDPASGLTRAQLGNRAARAEMRVDLVLNLNRAATTPTTNTQPNGNHLPKATLKVMVNNSIILATSLATSMVEDGNYPMY